MPLSAYIPATTSATADPGLSNIPDSDVSVAIKQNLEFLLMTRPGEYAMDLVFGVGMPNYLFTLETEAISDQIKADIKNQVKKYMPYITVDSIAINYDGIDNHELRMIIKYTIIQSRAQEVYEFTNSQKYLDQYL